MVNNKVNQIKTGNIIDLKLLKRVLDFAKYIKVIFILQQLQQFYFHLVQLDRFLLTMVDNYIIIPDKENLLKITILLLVLLL